MSLRTVTVSPERVSWRLLIIIHYITVFNLSQLFLLSSSLRLLIIVHYRTVFNLSQLFLLNRMHRPLQLKALSNIKSLLMNDVIGWCHVTTCSAEILGAFEMTECWSGPRAFPLSNFPTAVRGNGTERIIIKQSDQRPWIGPPGWDLPSSGLNARAESV